MSANVSKLGLKLIVGVSTAVVSVVASAMTEKAVNKVFTTTDETDDDYVVDETPETDTEEIKEEEK